MGLATKANAEAKPISKVVVVGGGTAGWMAAAALVSLLPGAFTLTLVESEAIGIVGVGEATLPHIRAFNERLGIDEAEFMSATRGTFKLGIEFADWGAIGDSYIHPFGTFGHGGADVNFHQYWLRLKQAAIPVPKLDTVSMGVMVARGSRFSRPDSDPQSIASTFGYAYQFDATLYAPFLRSLAERRGATRIEGKIVGVERLADGDIRAVVMEDGTLVEGDLFIDCSGFRSLLLGETLDEPFEDWSQWLPCDRAVAVPCRTGGEITPYTSAIAMPAGWRWRIPLQHRTGNGYVYSSAHLSDDEARRALLAAIEGEPLAEPRMLRFKAGRRRRSWVRNCIGIGLASGFLEPLESTSIYLVQAGITALVELFPDGRDSRVDRDEFNRLIDMEYDRIRDFLILHYHATTRSDSPFWDQMRTMTVPETLAEKMELFRRRGRVVKYREGVFLDASWVAVYLGQGVIPEGHDLRADAPPAEAVVRAIDSLAHEIDTRVNAMPSHADYIARHCAMRDAA